MAVLPFVHLVAMVLVAGLVRHVTEAELSGDGMSMAGNTSVHCLLCGLGVLA